ncbi:tyrosine-type recombinase/integrase [Haliscomenobacter hydrossis]|uniref:Integrase family protein n=1 Tax=Haliscomenobacter hydrossis (strain ATCC 27775 / DSM 1100 / LMG 10767 / O) TaxID=760192 RepID=F4L3U3_HALH1|nr:tyrosine-type recombinase/integrase [Haliscomenobacter hydrossis]AEE48697.1 integrase family protein [Haliscomenobacter hydrossis DSM 1100]
MAVHFNLRDKSAQSKTSIFLVVRHHGKNYKYSTGLSVDPSLWDASKNRPLSGKLLPLKAKLNDLELKVERAMSEAEYLTAQEFKDLMDRVTGKVEGKDKTYFLQYVREFCDGKTRATLKSTATALVNFITGSSYTQFGKIDWAKVNAKDIRFDDIDFTWRQRFYNYCTDQGLTALYIQQRLRHIAQMLNASRFSKLHSNDINKMRGWADVKNSEVRHTPITLSLEEISRLAALELNEGDAKVRDLFLIGVYSGQRWSDCSRIKPDQVKGNRLYFVQQKTSSKAIVPLDLWAGLVPETLGEILERYDNAAPTLPTCRPDIFFNERLQFICRRAGITEQVQVITTAGGKVETTYVEKWRKVRSHTARRTFCTIWYKGKMSLASIAQFSGHKSVDQLKTYIGLTDEEYQQAAESEAQAARELLLSKVI